MAYESKTWQMGYWEEADEEPRFPEQSTDYCPARGGASCGLLTLSFQEQLPRTH